MSGHVLRESKGIPGCWLRWASAISNNAAFEVRSRTQAPINARTFNSAPSTSATRCRQPSSNATMSSRSVLAIGVRAPRSVYASILRANRSTTWPAGLRYRQIGPSRSDCHPRLWSSRSKANHCIVVPTAGSMQSTSLVVRRCARANSSRYRPMVAPPMNTGGRSIQDSSPATAARVTSMALMTGGPGARGARRPPGFAPAHDRVVASLPAPTARAVRGARGRRSARPGVAA